MILAVCVSCRSAHKSALSSHLSSTNSLFYGNQIVCSQIIVEQNGVWRAAYFCNQTDAFKQVDPKAMRIVWILIGEWDWWNFVESRSNSRKIWFQWSFEEVDFYYCITIRTHKHTHGPFVDEREINWFNFWFGFSFALHEPLGFITAQRNISMQSHSLLSTL